jgi:hypothetical protein
LALAGLVAHESDELSDRERFTLNVVAPQPRVPARWRQQRRQDPDGCRLAGAIQTQEAVQLAFPDSERDAVNGDERTESPCEPVRLDGVLDGAAPFIAFFASG